MADSLSINAVTSFVVSISSYKTELEDKLEEGIKLNTEYHVRIFRHLGVS